MFICIVLLYFQLTYNNCSFSPSFSVNGSWNLGASTVALKINACYVYCITHKLIRLSQVICANGSRKLFRFRVR